MGLGPAIHRLRADDTRREFFPRAKILAFRRDSRLGCSLFLGVDSRRGSTLVFETANLRGCNLFFGVDSLVS